MDRYLGNLCLIIWGLSRLSYNLYHKYYNDGTFNLESFKNYTIDDWAVFVIWILRVILFAIFVGWCAILNFFCFVLFFKGISDIHKNKKN